MKFKKTVNQVFSFAKVYYVVLEPDDTPEVFIKKFKIEADTGIGWPAVTISNFGDNEYYVVFLADKDGFIPLQYITHEVFHLVYNILDAAGVKLSPDSDETFAYMTGYYNDSIVSWLNKNNFRIKIS